MNKITVLSLFWIFALISCKTSEKEIDKLELAKHYYNALNNSDEVEMAILVGDSIVVREREADYEERFSRNGYLEWLQWDAVFKPTYKIIDIVQEDGIVKAKISKLDKRIFFLHEAPMVWNDVVHFENHKITKVERINYEVFNVPKFLKNREGLVSWIKANHPELDGFINDQTTSGGMKYLKAIEGYENKQ